MREIRPSGSEGGGGQANALSLPLSGEMQKCSLPTISLFTLHHSLFQGPGTAFSPLAQADATG